MKKLLSTFLLLCSMQFGLVHAATDFSHQHELWNSLLEKHVHPFKQGSVTQVDYAGMKKDRAQLLSYLASLSAVKPKEFDSWHKNEQLAFLINAYNAWTIEFILTAWPDIESIKELGNFFNSPWAKTFIPLLGETRSLDNIEHTLIRGSSRYQDPRIHFAVNCASIGCPALRAEAFQGKILSEQLEEQTHLFLSDRTRNRIENNSIHLSSIFKWYREDFEKGWMNYHSLESFLLNYASALSLSADKQNALKLKKLNIEFLSYDWRLNKLEN